MDFELRRFYSTSQNYLARLKSHTEETFLPCVKLCEAKLIRGTRILDCGCGIGTSSYMLSQSGFVVTGLDLSPMFLAEAVRKYGEVPNLDFLAADLEHLPYENEVFDAVCCYDVLEHVADISKSLTEAARVIKKNGVLIVFIPNHLDPVQHLIRGLKRASGQHAKPWEAKSRIGSFWYFAKTSCIFIGKLMGGNKTIYNLKPILSDVKEISGQDYDATWLTNWFDIETIMRSSGFSIEHVEPPIYQDRIMRILMSISAPGILRRFYEKLRIKCVLVGRKI